MTVPSGSPRFCVECGAELVGDAKFCAACGRSVGTPVTVPTTVPAATIPDFPEIQNANISGPACQPFPEGVKGSLTSITGMVTGHRKWSDTHVSGGGGSSYVGSQGGMVRHATISSNVVQNTDFFIKNSKGEHPIQTSGCDYPLRDGQVVSVYSMTVGERQCKNIHLVNHSTGEQTELVSMADMGPFLYAGPEFVKPKAMSLRIAGAAFFLFLAFVSWAKNVSVGI